MPTNPPKAFKPGPPAKAWPHAPLHQLSINGTYIVSAGTYLKVHHFRNDDRLNHLETMLLSLAVSYGWQIEAWAVFANHYHFVAHSPPNADTLKTYQSRLHTQTAIHVNQLDGTPGRKVWYNFWEMRLTFEKSYLARLNYVHQNAVKHEFVPVANQWRWCSAAWFERTVTPAMLKTVYGFKTDQVRVRDDY